MADSGTGSPCVYAIDGQLRFVTTWLDSEAV
jgi:hypothetical protein